MSGRRLGVFNHLSLDGYFVDSGGGMSWAHTRDADPEWTAFVEGNAGGGGTLVFGRVTYDMMAGFWPSPQAAQMMPAVAERMNNLPKVVFSRTMQKASWNNTALLKGDLAADMRALKAQSGPDLVIMGSGSLVAQLAGSGLIDSYQFVVDPVVLGGGRTMFEGLTQKLALRRASFRAFNNGNVLLTYEPAKAAPS